MVFIRFKVNKHVRRNIKCKRSTCAFVHTNSSYYTDLLEIEYFQIVFFSFFFAELNGLEHEFVVDQRRLFVTHIISLNFAVPVAAFRSFPHYFQGVFIDRVDMNVGRFSTGRCGKINNNVLLVNNPKGLEGNEYVVNCVSDNNACFTFFGRDYGDRIGRFRQTDYVFRDDSEMIRCGRMKVHYTHLSFVSRGFHLRDVRFPSSYCSNNRTRCEKTKNFLKLYAYLLAICIGQCNG